MSGDDEKTRKLFEEISKDEKFKEAYRRYMVKDQFPVETRYGVLWQGVIHDIHECKEDAVEDAASTVHFDKALGSAQVVDLELRLLNQPPCEWERSNHWGISYFYGRDLEDGHTVEYPHEKINYCPNCGRRLN